MVMWKFKCCPRCGGDMFLDSDLDSWYEQCLQCCFRNELRDMAEFKQERAERERNATLAGKGAPPEELYPA